MRLLSIFCLALLVIRNIWGRDYVYFHRSPRGLMMGDAYTTLATGPSTLFYNPALLARNKLFAFYPLPIDIEVFNILDEEQRFEELENDDVAELANAIIGFPISLKAASAPTLKFARVALTPFAISRFNAIIRDRIHPIIDIDYRYDRGISLGLGFIPYGRSRKGWSVAFGIAFKYIKREGIIDQYDLFGVKFADLITSGSMGISEIKQDLGFSIGRGIGMDLGLDWRHQGRSSAFALGFSIQDVLDTKIEVFHGEGKLPAQQMNLSFGTSFSQKLGRFFDWAWAFDLHPLGEDIDFEYKIHGGLRLGLPILDVFVGSNAGLTSYGVAFDLFAFDVALGTYGKRAGGAEREYLALSISLLDFAF